MRPQRPTLRLFLGTYALMWAVTLLVALIVAIVPGAAEAARDAFAFDLDAPREGSWLDAWSYFTTNIRLVLAVLLAAWARPRSGVFALPLDALVVSTVVANLALVGTAAGAFGMIAAAWLLHLPLEWAALCCVIAAYVVSPRSASLGACGVAAAALLAAAAVVEVVHSGRILW